MEQTGFQLRGITRAAEALYDEKTKTAVYCDVSLLLTEGANKIPLAGFCRLQHTMPNFQISGSSCQSI